MPNQPTENGGVGELLEYFDKINDLKSLKVALSENLSPRRDSDDIFTLYLNALKKRASGEVYQKVLEKLRLLLVLWIGDLKLRGTVSKEEFLQFIWCCRTWKFPYSSKLEEFKNVHIVGMEGIDDLLLIDDAIRISRGEWPPIELPPE